MPAPVFVTFRHMSPRAELEEYARDQAEHLEHFFSRIVDCRVLLEPSDTGLLRVVVELTVPGERLVASHESEPEATLVPEEERRPVPEYRWLHAMHEAFAAAGRILQDHVGRQRSRARQPRALVRP
jgi:hypothetical protein